MGEKWYKQLSTCMGGLREGEGEVPSPDYTSDGSPSEENQPPHFLWGGYVLQGKLCIIAIDNLLLGSWLTSIQSPSWYVVSSHSGGHVL